ncbi:MAG: helix-turn-helix transcriptional regulator [Rhodoferax sp.]
MKNSPLIAPLPTLLFGESDAARQTNHTALVDRMNQIRPGVNAYDPISSPNTFSCKFSSFKLASMQLTAIAMSPTFIDRTGVQGATLMIPLSGGINYSVEGQPFHYGLSQGSLYLPQNSGQFRGGSDTIHHLLLQFEPQLLEKTALAMLGLPANAAIDLQLENPRLTPLTVAGQPFSTILQHLGKLIDLYQRDAKVLTQLGVQDILFRHIVMMLRPEVFLSQIDLPRSNASAALVKQLCDYMHAHLDAGLTLTDLESFSGLSARSLQLAFKKQLGCSPMQWLTVQKLHNIRAKLASADTSESITSLAVAYFPNLGDFARYYRRQFGELPSQTRARRTC